MTSPPSTSDDLPQPRTPPKSPLDKAGFLNRLTMMWTTRLIREGFKRHLEEEDVWDVAEKDNPVDSRRKFWENYRRIYAEKRGPNGPRIHNAATKTPPPHPPSITWRALYAANLPAIVASSLLYLLSVGLRFVGPVLLQILVTFISQTSNNQPTSISVGVVSHIHRPKTCQH